MGRAVIRAGLVILIFLHCASTFKLVCYFSSWSQYRETGGRFLTDNIDANLCTHIIYAFANLSNNAIVPMEWNDATTFGNLNSLKTSRPGLKTLLSIGGYSMGPKPFSKIASSAHRRSVFVNSAIQLLRRYNFDGLDLAWDSAEPADKRRLGNLVEDISILFNKEAQDSGKEKLLLSVALPAGREAIDKGYDVTRISTAADFINFMTFDFHGSWEKHTGHLSPLQKGKSDTGTTASQYNVDFAVRYLLQIGAPAEKIIMGITTYGRTFTLSSRQTIVGAPASGPGTPGPFTKEPGQLAYYEICSFNSGAQKEWIEEQAVPYSYKGNQWVGYEDVTSVRRKVQYMKDKSLGGVMIWALDLDDFSGSHCGQGKYPIVGTVKEELAKKAPTLLGKGK